MTAQVAASVPGPGAARSFASNPAPAEVRVYALRATAIDLDAALDVATAASDRVPLFQLRADWNRNGSYDHRWSDLTRMVQQFSFTQELATDLPATVGFLEGTGASKLSVTLGGQFMTDGYVNPDGTYLEDVDAVEAFSPYGVSGPGPIIGCNLELRTGFQTPEGPVDLLQFTGEFTGYSPSAATREVELDGLDPVSNLRRPITQYAFGVDGVVLANVGNVKYPWAINSQWFIDRILRANAYFASPPPGGVFGFGSVILSATMHGSHQLEVGSLAYVISGYYPNLNAPLTTVVYEYGVEDPSDPNRLVHPYRMMYPRFGYDYTVKWITRSPGPMRPGLDGWGMSGLVQLPAAGSTVTGEMWTFQPADRAGPQIVMQLRFLNGIPYAYILLPSGDQALYTITGVTLGSAPQWMFVGVHFLSETGGVRMTMRFGSFYAQAFLPYAVAPLAYEPLALAFGRTILPFTNFSIWYSPVVPGALDWFGQGWTSAANIDPGLNWIGGNPDIINRESYDLIKEIVEAEFGTFYFDEYGTPNFRSRIIDRNWNRAPEELTSEQSLSDLVVSVDDSSVRNSIDYEFSLWAVDKWEVIWQPEDPYFFSLGAGANMSYTIQIPENTPIVAETDANTVKWVSSELWDQVDDNPYYADKIVFAASLLSDPTVDVWAAATAGTINTSGGNFTFRVRRIDPRSALLTIVNNFSFGVRFATASKKGTNSSTGLVDNSMTTEGTPAFRLTGRKLIEYPSLTASTQDQASILQYGLRTYDLGGKNQWRQTYGSGDILSRDVMAWTSRPKPVLSDVEVPHNPRRKLYDKIILTEPSSFGARIWCTLAGRTITYSSDGARDTLALRPDHEPPGW